MAEFDADKLSKRLEQLNREELAALEALSDRLLSELEGFRAGPKRADGSKESERPAAKTSRGVNKRSRAV